MSNNGLSNIKANNLRGPTRAQPSGAIAFPTADIEDVQAGERLTQLQRREPRGKVRRVKPVASSSSEGPRGCMTPS